MKALFLVPVLISVQTFAQIVTQDFMDTRRGQDTTNARAYSDQIVAAARAADTTRAIVRENDLAVSTATAGVGTSPTSSSTTNVTHGLGRTPIVIRIYGKDTFLANAAALPPTGSIGIWCSSGNRCVFQPYDATTITAAEPAATSTAFAIRQNTGVGNFITGVIGNVGATTFDIVWTETGTHTAQVYLWEAQ